MKIIITTIAVFNLILSLAFVIQTACQSKQEITPATFPGGKKQLETYINENMQWQQSQITVEGKVYVNFIVKKDGSVSDIKIYKNLCDTCDKEAIRLVENMPKWIPAKKAGQNVDFKVVLPIKFSL